MIRDVTPTLGEEPATMSEHDDLFTYLPSHNLDRLAAAVGQRLRDVVRVFTAAPFADDRFDARDEFRYRSGPTTFRFDGVAHDLSGWGSQLSVVLLPTIADADRVTDDDEHRVVRLGASGDAMAQLVGLRCEDVRIWTYDDGDDLDRACECAVSYLLHGGGEVAYCTWLHGDMDTDYVLPGHLVWRDRARACWSVARSAPLTFAEYSRG